MRTLLVVALLALVPSCLPGFSDYEPEPYEPPQCFRSLCVTTESPFAFDTGSRFGVGTEVEVTYLTHISLGNDFEFVAFDPDVVQVSRGQHGRLTVRALRAGTALLRAQTRSGALLAERSLVTAEIATIDFSWRAPPVGSETISAIAGFVGRSDRVGVAFRDADGELLGGSAPVTVDDLAVATRIDPPWDTVDGFEDDRLQFGLAFHLPGVTTANVMLFDGRTASLPIETVVEPATLEIMFLRYVDGLPTRVSRVNTEEHFSATIVGRTADGRYVAGVDATWTGSSSVEFMSDNYTRSIELQLLAPGDATVTADVEGQLATATISAR
ncbi:MAG TPA: hypothetical protein VIU61_29710 [Kofleriaceae bacterium]